MKLKKRILLFIMTSLVFTTISSQTKSFSFFGSYMNGVGNLTSSVNSNLKYPIKDETNKLRSGSTNQFEAGTYYKRVGLGVIHATYSTKASTPYSGADLNYDGLLENGVLSDNLTLSFTGIELLYKLPLFKSKFDITWKIGLGFQSYTINKGFDIQGEYWNSYNYTLKGDILTSMAGVELNYQIWKIIGIGLETSILPGNYTKLTNSQSSSYIFSDNVSRINSGFKIKISI